MGVHLRAAPLYRQREFHQSPLWRILVDHGEEFLRTYDSRYEETHGPLPLQSARVMEKLLRCGDPRYGLTLLHCPDCQVHMAVPFSCKTRVCPSCINRRAEVLSHTLAEKSRSFSHSGDRRPVLSGRQLLRPGLLDQPALLSELRHSILKSLVARNCLQP